MGSIVLLDVMDTLVRDPFHEELPAFFGTNLEGFLRDKAPSMWPAFERGELGEAEYLAGMFADGRPVDAAALRAHLRASYRWLPGAVRVLDGLRAAGTPRYTLSNYPVWSELVEGALGLSRWAPWDFVSWRTGVRKPDPEAYLGVARELDCAPERLVFVDDRRRNIEAAAACGLRAIHYRSGPQIFAELQHLGLVEEPPLRVVAGAVLGPGGLLAARCPPGSARAGQWELPGGKVESAESDAQALARELAEELEVRVEVQERLASGVHPGDAGPIRLIVHRCRLVSGRPRAVEHAALRWLTPPEALQLDWSAADRALLPEVLAAL